MVHEGVYAVFELDGERVVRGEKVVLGALGVEREMFVGDGYGSVLGGFLCGELGLSLEELGDEEVGVFRFVVFYDHGTLYLGEVPPPFDVLVGDAGVS